jgi:hypothetical protein
MTIPATIKSGKLEYNRFAFEAFAKRGGDGEYDMELHPRGTAKTSRQLAYVFGVVVPVISEHLGYTREDVRYYLKKRFGAFVERVDIDTGEIVSEPKSMARYTKGEASVFIDESIQFATSIGCMIPHPEDLR